jgi:hypothetical protein
MIIDAADVQLFDADSGKRLAEREAAVVPARPVPMLASV